MSLLARLEFAVRAKKRGGGGKSAEQRAQMLAVKLRFTRKVGQKHPQRVVDGGDVSSLHDVSLNSGPGPYVILIVLLKTSFYDFHTTCPVTVASCPPPPSRIPPSHNGKRDHGGGTSFNTSPSRPFAIVASPALFDGLYDSLKDTTVNLSSDLYSAGLAVAHTVESLLSNRTAPAGAGSFAKNTDGGPWLAALSQGIDSLTDFLSGRTALENTSLLLALSTFVFLLIRNTAMSGWTSRFGNLGRFSPFTRSPTNAGGSTKVSDADFSYITADDLRKHQAEAGRASDPRERAPSPPIDYGPARDTDVVILRNKRKEYAVHFAAYSIAKGELTVATLRDAATKKLGLADARRMKLIYKGRVLKDDERQCRQEGMRDGSEVMCSVADVSASATESDDDEYDTADGIDGQPDGDGTRRRRNRGKKTKKRNKREAAQNSGTSTPDPRNLDVPPRSGAPSSRAQSPRSGTQTPQTPMDKLNALHAKLQTYIPDCENFMRHPPTEPAKKEFEHKKLSETILTQVLLQLDGVETEGDADARARRKELVKETQRVLQDLDGVMKG